MNYSSKKLPQEDLRHRKQHVYAIVYLRHNIELCFDWDVCILAIKILLRGGINPWWRYCSG